MSELLDLVGVVLAGLGGLLVLGGIQATIGAGRHVAGTETTITASTRHDRAVLTGEIVDAPETFTTPIGQEPYATVSCWAVEQCRRQGVTGRSADTTWKTVAAGVKSRPFLLDDGTGTALVDPPELAQSDAGTTITRGVGSPELQCEIEYFGTKERVDAGGRTPAHVQQFIEAHPVVPEQREPAPGGLKGLCGRRYTEGTLTVGDTVTVVGAAETTSADAETDVVVRPGDDGPMLLSDQDFEALERNVRNNRSMLRNGAALAVTGIVMVVFDLPL